MHIIKREYLLSALALVSAVGATPNWQDPPVPVMVLSYDAPSRVLHFPVSYTHLDVYKRQVPCAAAFQSRCR